MTPEHTALVAQAEKYLARAQPNFVADGFISGLIGVVRALAGELADARSGASANTTTMLMNVVAERDLLAKQFADMKTYADAMDIKIGELTSIATARELIMSELHIELAALRAEVAALRKDASGRKRVGFPPEY